MNKSKVGSQNNTNKFSKWPYFTIWTAPSTVKSKHIRANTVSGKSKGKNIVGEKASFSAVSQSNSRTRSTSKKHKKPSGVRSTNKSIERDSLANRLGYCKQHQNSNKLAKHQKYQFLNFGLNKNFKTSKKRKISKKKKITKSGTYETGESVKTKIKGFSSDWISESSSLKRKPKNQSTSPRNNNIEDLMKQFLVMKNQSNENELYHKYAKENFSTSGLTKEQTNSIMNISSQGGPNMSFINWNIRLGENRPKSKENQNKVRFDYSPKYPVRNHIKNVVNSKNYDRRLILANNKNRKTQQHWNSDNFIEKWWTHDERNQGLNLEPSTSAANVDEDYATFSLYNDEKCMPGSKPLMNYMKPKSSMNQKHSKPKVDPNMMFEKYVKMVPNKSTAKKGVKGKHIAKKSQNQVKSFSINKTLVGGKMIISPNQISKHIKPDSRVFSISPKSKNRDKLHDASSKTKLML